MKWPLVLIALLLAGCSTAVPAQEGPVSVHLIHRYDKPSDPDHFTIGTGAPRVHLNVTLENFYRARCPGPSATITLKDPTGAEYAKLESPQLPTSDCVKTFEQNDTALRPGTWTVEYAGGSNYIGSIVDVRS
ncbi:MAG: hypothetical protein WDA16_14675 [Candidatus Thermoplasmatota archaeon]